VTHANHGGKDTKVFRNLQIFEKKNDGLIWIYPYATSGAGYLAFLTMRQINLAIRGTRLFHFFLLSFCSLCKIVTKVKICQFEEKDL
jgi:hypothetical protein